MREVIVTEALLTVPMGDPLIRCRDCRYWQTEIAFVTTGRCKHEDLKGLICNKNFFCANAEAK